jgi:hypothetical protein
MTDTERLDFLQKLTDRNNYTGTVILRESTTGRGWRLHEHSGDGAVSSVREAIDNFMANKAPQLSGGGTKRALKLLHYILTIGF